MNCPSRSPSHGEFAYGERCQWAAGHEGPHRGKKLEWADTPADKIRKLEDRVAALEAKVGAEGPGAGGKNDG